MFLIKPSASFLLVLLTIRDALLPSKAERAKLMHTATHIFSSLAQSFTTPDFTNWISMLMIKWISRTTAMIIQENFSITGWAIAVITFWTSCQLCPLEFQLLACRIVLSALTASLAGCNVYPTLGLLTAEHHSPCNSSIVIWKVHFPLRLLQASGISASTSMTFQASFSLSYSKTGLIRSIIFMHSDFMLKDYLAILSRTSCSLGPMEPGSLQSLNSFHILLTMGLCIK